MSKITTKRISLIINCLALLVCLVINYNKSNEFQEIEFGFDKIEDGFKAIDMAYLEPLKETRHITDSIISSAAREIKNDTLALLLINQNSLGKYYLDYHEATQNELFKISNGIAFQKDVQRSLLISVIVIVLFNVVSIVYWYRE